MELNSIADSDSQADQLITKCFLINALTEGKKMVKDSQIVSYSITPGTKPGDNYMSVIYSVDVNLELESEPFVPKTLNLVIKCYPSHPERQKLANKSNMFFKELEFYRKWVPELKRFQSEVLGLDRRMLNLPFPPYVHGQCIDFSSEEGELRKSSILSPLDNYIIMEDMRKTKGFLMTNRRDALDLDHMTLVIKSLAKIHSLSWAYRNHVENDIVSKFKCFQDFNKKDKGVWRQILESNLDLGKGIFDQEFGKGNKYSEAVDRFKSQIDKIMAYFSGEIDSKGLEDLLRDKPDAKKFGMDSEKPEPWRVISHGDCWSNNLLFRYDPESKKPVEIILVDQQIAQETCVTNDLQSIIYSCTEQELRRNHLDELLTLYHDTFNKYCRLLKTETLPGFEIESLKFRFHRAKCFGFFVAVVGLPIALQEEGNLHLDGMGDDKGVAEMFTQGIGGSNLLLRRRLIQLAEDMCNDGVL